MSTHTQRHRNRNILYFSFTSMVGSYSSTKWFWMSWMVSALLPTPPAPTTTSLYSVMIHLQVKKKQKYNLIIWLSSVKVKWKVLVYLVHNQCLVHFPLKTILQSNHIQTLSFLYNNPFVYWKSAHSGLAEWEDINIWTPLPVSNSTRPQLFF